MKKAAAVLLCLALLFGLCACTQPGSASQDPATQAGETRQGQPEAPTDENGAVVPAAPEAPETSEAPVVPTYDGGGVHTDYSQYKPRESAPAAKYTRLSEDWISELAPGSYGQIFPFAADTLYYSSDAGYGYPSGNYYGFVTEAGEIICDPTYTELRPMYFYDYNTNQRYSQPFWVMGRATDVHEVQDGEYSWLDGDLVYGVASLDGSVVLPLQFCYVEPLTVGFAGFRSWNTVDFDVYNDQGERIFGAAELADELAGGSYVNIQYGQGYYTVGSYIGDENVTYAVDRNGHVLFGPVRYLGEYGDGLFPASEDGDHYGFMDASGNWAIEPIYTSVNSFRDGYAICYNGSQAFVIDSSGVVRISADRGYFTQCGEYFSYDGGYEANLNRIYSASGEQLLESRRSGEYWNYLGGSLFSASRENSLRIVDVASGEEYALRGTETLSYNYAEGGWFYEGRPCIMVYSYEDDPESEYGGRGGTIFLTEDLQLLAQLQDDAVLRIDDWISGESYTAIGGGYDGSLARFYAADGTLIGSYRPSNTRVMNGWIQTTDEFSARLFDPSGREVFCYPILSMLDD